VHSESLPHNLRDGLSLNGHGYAIVPSHSAGYPNRHE
jgi:hypothetical protein